MIEVVHMRGEDFSISG